MPIKETDILKTILLNEVETETLPQGFEDDPMGFILKKYPGLNSVMEYMMTESFREYVDGVFVVAPKPTTFKILLHNGQFFFLQFMGKAYQATVQGKNYYLMSIGEKERCMLAIARLLRYGNPIKTKGPEGAEQGTRPEGETGGEGGEASTGGGETGGEAGGETAPEAGGGEEEAPVTESMILETILKKSLFEASGIMYRKRGDKFSDGTTQLTFDSAEKYPKTGNSYQKKEDMDAEIQDLEKQFGKKIDFVNSPAKGLMSFGLATLIDDSGEKVYWGRYFKTTASDSWENNKTPGGKFKLQVARAVKYQVPISPQDLIKNENQYADIRSVINEVDQNASQIDPALKKQLIDALNDINNGNLPVFKDQADNLPAIRDNFGEIMSPLALTKGMVVGAASEAEKLLLQKGETWANCEVSWVMPKNEKLVDSKLISPSGIVVLISSKGEKGADSSATNIWTAIQKSDEKLQEKYKDFVEIIKIINDFGQEEQIFVLADKVGIGVSQNLKKEIMGYMKTKKPDFSNISSDAEKLVKDGESAGIKPKYKNPNFNAGRALLSILAKLVVEKINQNENIKFSEAAKKFMNNSSLVQVYCYMTKSGNDAKVTEFKAMYPPNFEGEMVLGAKKNYSSSQTKGKLTFGFSDKQKKSEEEDSEETTV